MSIPSQSQSSPLVHFTTTMKQKWVNGLNLYLSSPSISISSEDDQHLSEFFARPQSTPVSSPMNRVNIEKKSLSTELNPHGQYQLSNINDSTMTNVTPLDENRLCLSSKILLDILKSSDEDDRHLLRPPPLLVLSQSIQSKHPEQLIETKLNHRLSRKKDLPNCPANYSLVFYNLTETKLDEAKRLTRRMGNCFTSENFDLLTTHLILPKDSPSLDIDLNLILALIHRCRLVTFDWLKSSSRIGEWLNEKKFQPKLFLKANSSLNIYRSNRRKSKGIDLFKKFGTIYVTSTVKQRSLIVKLISLLGGDITVNRDRAQLIVGHSSKILPIIIPAQVDEQWVVDSILAGKCQPMEKYLLDLSILS